MKPVASLRLTVALLACAMVLVLAGTWAQIDRGIWQVQKAYFHSFYVWIDFQLFLPRPKGGQAGLPGGFPMMGGYTLIGLLVINLLAAHALRFKLTLKRSGINLLHAGLILLLLGEIITSLFAAEGQMTIREGHSKNYAEDVRTVELALIDASPSDRDDVTAIAQSRLHSGATITHPSLPFSIHIDSFLANSTLLGPFQAAQEKLTSSATAGEAKDIVALESPEFSGTASEASSINLPSAYVTLALGDSPLGTYLVSANIPDEHTVDVNGRPYRIALRFHRDYKPYSIDLIKFHHDKFTGTEMARNFSSQIHLDDPSHGETRETTIRMNEPLRYRGETIYQSGFDENDPAITTLTIVRNPGWLIPYISCSMVAAGMVTHFGITLIAFLRRTAMTSKEVAQTAEASTAGGRILLPALGVLLGFAYLASTWFPPGSPGTFDFVSFSRLPISYEGRVMPMDSLARNSLRILSGRSEFVENGRRLPATQWLLDTLSHSTEMTKHAVLRIDHPDLKNLLTLDPARKLFSYGELEPRLRVLDEQVTQLSQVRRDEWTPYQHQIALLTQHLLLIQRLADVDSLYVSPPQQSGEDWATLASARQAAANGSPQAMEFEAILADYSRRDATNFNESVRASLQLSSRQMPEIARRTHLEMLFNRAEPFYQLMILYVVIFLLICASWLTKQHALQRSGFWLLLLALAYHTIALGVRIHLSGRPPVTNLYSSAIFIAWAAAVFCALLEKIYRNGIGTLAAAFVAFPSLLIAHSLAGSGDTMQMLQAVLDTNFWLATHVVVITLGYSATFLAGILAAFYVMGGVFTGLLSREETRKSLSRMIYGILCFAMLFSFVGTILGGIWADQSWGRFWGWDPKENGAVLIVIWNALILHARWGGLVKARGIALLAIAGNAVTSFSWFGTNMLGIGLHSYGFMQGATFWLSTFIALQFAMIALGSIPTAYWRSARLLDKSSRHASFA